MKHNFLGTCVDEDLINELFGSVTDFAYLVEENGDEFEYKNLVIKYNEETDIHSFYKKVG